MKMISYTFFFSTMLSTLVRMGQRNPRQDYLNCEKSRLELDVNTYKSDLSKLLYKYQEKKDKIRKQEKIIDTLKTKIEAATNKIRFNKINENDKAKIRNDQMVDAQMLEIEKFSLSERQQSLNSDQFEIKRLKEMYESAMTNLKRCENDNKENK